MGRREDREQIIKVLYTLEIGGSFEEDEHSPFVVERVKDVIEKIDEIDEILKANLEGWSIDRLNNVDKGILRYAIYEMKYQDLPKEIAINEAINITKKYSDIDGKQKAFNNKVLDKVIKYINAK